MQIVKKFVFGKETNPQWFVEQCSLGRVKINYEDGEIINATIYTPTKSIIAIPGDVILYTKSGLSVLPADKAVKYGVQKNVQKNVKYNKEEKSQ